MAKRKSLDSKIYGNVKKTIKQESMMMKTKNDSMPMMGGREKPGPMRKKMMASTSEKPESSKGPASVAGTKKKKKLKNPKNKVHAVMSEFKRGTLKAGKTGKKVTSRKQAIAVGLSEARRAGAKIPKKA